jgi:1,4-alpha-glucan branching enzyme
MKDKRIKQLALVRNDPWLKPVTAEITARYERYQDTLQEIEKNWESLNEFANAYTYYGFHYDRLRKGWVYREWAPKAQDLYLFGDFNNWQRYSHRLTPIKNGQWEIFLPDEQYRDRFTHLSRVKIMVHSDAGWHEKIPAFINRVVQDPASLDFSGQHWAPVRAFDWEGDRFDIRQLNELLIYECHIGMAQEREAVGTFVEFADYIIPYI